jgi:4-oxalocrotonate tautomerase
LPDRAIRVDGSKMARSREDPRALTDETASREANRRSRSVPLIQVKLIENVFSPAQKREIIQRLTDTMVEIEGENMRPVTWVTIDEVASGEWGVAGNAVTTADWRAIQAGIPA